MALLLRMRRATRQVPLVFVGGDPAKVNAIQRLLPDAVYSSWEQVEDSIRDAIMNPPSDPVVPDSQFQAYARKPIYRKLGIKPDSSVVLVDAPTGFEDVLGELPAGVQLSAQPGTGADLTLWFARSMQDLRRGIKNMAATADQAPLWNAWPKKASGRETDLTQQAVREAGLAAGLVDYKVCSICEVWSGLLFSLRRSEG